ncbi:csnB [Candida theae]|uniref:CsnB n=1 Tax=Candida theae TaxID=1198502 RepID=A0AAD5B9T7_9ASCO|nr:csnB [Candida theae]KAI5948740.1 csnB [Candida theae]
MSDEELFSEDSYEFEFEEDEEEHTGGGGSGDENNAIDEDGEDQGIENRYYMAKSFKDDEVEKAIVEFKKIIDSSIDDGDKDGNEWVFKAYKQLIKLYLSESQLDNVLTTMQSTLLLLPLLSKSYVEESLSRMIVRFANVPNSQFVTQMYRLLLSQEYIDKNDKLWLKVNTNLLALYLETGELDKIPHLLQIIYDKFPSIPEPIRKLFTLEIIAAEIEYLFKMEELDIPKLTQLYKQSSNFTTAVTHPKILGVIAECGARVQFFREDYEQARAEFYKSFKNYDEAGAHAKNKSLKYLALCSLLCNSDLDPFQSQETRTCAQLAEFDDLKRLIKAYKNMSVVEFNSVLQQQQKQQQKQQQEGEDEDEEGNEFFKDEIFKQAITQILENLRIRVLMKNIASASTPLPFTELYKVLQVEGDEFCQLLVKLMGTGRLIDAKIDFENEVVVVHEPATRLLVPTTSKEIYYNVKLLDTLTVTQDDSMVIEETGLLFTGDQPPQNLDLLSRMFFVIDRPKKPQDWFKPIESWYSYVLSFLPRTCQLEVSQHEQVLDKIEKSKQNQDNNNNSRSSDAVANELANFNTGLLNSTLQDAYNDDDDEDIDAVDVKKVHLLQSWANALKN